MAAAPVASPPIPAGTHVSLRLPHVGALPAIVDAVEPGALVVALTVSDNRVERLAGQEAAIEATTARGIQRFTGTLQRAAGGPDVFRIALEGEAERIQRRDWARVDAVVPITVRAIDADLGGATHSLNMSAGGMLIADLWELPLGTDVRVELEGQAGEPPIRALGRVVRDAAPGQKGIRIDDIGREDEERLVRLVRERERAALRMGRR
jgi:c-di-GMP-binding flagellar brake protein YcgR